VKDLNMRNTTAKRKLRKATAAERRRLGLAKDATIETVDLHDPNLAPEHRDHFITGIKTEVARLDELIAYWYRHRDQCRIEGCDHGRAELSDQVRNLLSHLLAAKELFGVIIHRRSPPLRALRQRIRARCLCDADRDGARTMTDALLLLLVLGVLAIALAVDVAALLGWLRRRWR